ncbi:PspA/IM30 family protein [Microbacterium protaetiae]|uniref:PspA/IM30 family protein n=1 Tax=Microbacterium protaetiae TaxID=2509458 RepID=A0A4P6ERZ6_9MICO|nr:PspA/IM30 family protein [Microbacterium protaetiae]QAY60708.1 PspA/IM30 family protein [Microbacterium protaetiae]
MAKQSIFGRISTLLRANVNAMLDSAEDPKKMLDQLVRDFTNNIADAESAIAETIGNLRLLERDHEEDLQSATEWGNKAVAASKKADELRAGGHTDEADKFDNLAKVALQRQIQSENEAKAVEPQLAAQNDAVAKLKDGLNGMKQKLEQLKAKSSELIARQKTAEAQNKVADAVKSIDVMDPTSELGRFEDKIRREEALAAGKQELAASSLDAQFNQLEDIGELTEVEARLAALKVGNKPAVSGASAPSAIDAPSAPYTPGQ